jgi:hypothetical protein
VKNQYLNDPELIHAHGFSIDQGKLTLLFIISATFVSAVPFLALACGILPQAVIIQEIFGTNFSTLPAMWYGGYGVQVGHAYLVAFTYIPSALAHILFAAAGAFTQQLAFAVLVYLFYGSVLFVVLARAARAGIGWIGFAGLLTIALSSTMLERTSYFGLMITYHKGTELLFVVLAAVTMCWIRDQLALTRQTAVLLGALAAAFVGVKVSYLLLAGPPLLAMAASGPSEGRRERIAVFAIASISGLALIFAACALFVPQQIVALLRYVLASYTSGALVQASPFMKDEVFGLLDSNSVYLGWHLMLPVWVCTLFAAIARAWISRDSRLAVILMTQMIAVAFLAVQFRVRLAQSTMLDIVIFMTFSQAVLSFSVAQQSRSAAVALLVSLAAIFLISFFAIYPLDAFERMRLRSQITRQFETFRDSLGPVPSAYYVTALSQPVMFPSSDFFPIIGTSGSPGGTLYLQRFYPRFRLVDPSTPLREPHIAIVPEYLDAIPETPQRRAEWPQMYLPVDVFGTMPLFKDAIGPQRPACRVFQFPEIFDREHLIYVSNYATKVTVCPMPPR